MLGEEANLGRAQPWIEGDGDGAGEEGAEEGRDIGSAVGQESANVGAGLDPRGGDPRGDLPGVLEHLGVGGDSFFGDQERS